jgi:DNA polymerase-1
VVVIIDGNHLACRSYYGIKPLITTYGKETQCIYGVLNSLRIFYKRFKSPNTFFFIVWDIGGKSWRHKSYPLYKSDRAGIGGSFYEQANTIRDILKCFDINQYMQENVEADDFAGTLAFKARKKGERVLIISGDHDFEQLISSHIQVLCPKPGGKPEILKDLNYVRNTYQLEPQQLIEVMALAGDPSDHIGGIDGVGEKTAITLLKANNGLENLLKNVDNLKTISRKNNEVVDASENLKKKIKENIDTIRFVKKLVTIDLKLEIDFKLERRKPDFDKLQASFKEFEFNRFLSDIEKWKNDLLL